MRWFWLPSTRSWSRWNRFHATGFILNPRCRICRHDPLRTKVNGLLAFGASYAMILRSLEDANSELDKRDRVTIDSIRNHTARHFPVQHIARATYRDILERRAKENGVDFVKAVATAITPMAFYETVMAKGYETLVHPNTKVDINTGMILEICGSAREGAYLPGDRVKVPSKTGVATLVGKVRPMLTVVSDSADCDGSVAGAPLGSSLIDELVREGARRMLAEALQAEVDAYCARFADERDENGRRLVVRNGYHEPREVTTCAGAVAVYAPRVNDKRIDPETAERRRFCSSILPPWARKTPQIEQVLPLLYLHGLSSGGFRARPRAVPRQREGSVLLDDQAMIESRAGGTRIADLKVQMGRIIDAIHSTVPEELWPEILRKSTDLSRPMHRRMSSKTGTTRRTSTTPWNPRGQTSTAGLRAHAETDHRSKRISAPAQTSPAVEMSLSEQR